MNINEHLILTREDKRQKEGRGMLFSHIAFPKSPATMWAVCWVGVLMRPKQRPCRPVVEYDDH